MVKVMEETAVQLSSTGVFPYKRIMVAVDGSETSDLALLEAIKLARVAQSQLCIIHVTHVVPLQGVEIGLDLDRFQKIVLQDAKLILEQCSKIAHNQGVFAEIQIVEIRNAVERISESIITTTQSWRADLLVLGSHGRKGFNQFFLGSVAEETIRISPIPILMIRGQPSAE